MKAFILFLALLAVTNANLNKDIARVAERVDAVVGVSAIDLDTGRTISIRPDESFPMASVFKFPLAIEVLHRVDSGQLRLD
ncbi:MAG TPA: serine hydrolase, partial [Thermoanaerobaculia bacterium]